MLEKKQTKKIEEILTEIDLEQPAPAEEPMRQYYFMEKARRLVKTQAETLGRPLTFHVTTFGCQMNARDSEKLTGILEQTIPVRCVKMPIRRYMDIWDSSTV